MRSYYKSLAYRDLGEPPCDEMKREAVHGGYGKVALLGLLEPSDAANDGKGQRYQAAAAPAPFWAMRCINDPRDLTRKE